MVKNPRETPGADSIRPLNPPIPVQVEENEHQRPVAVTLRSQRLRVSSIDDLWKVEEEWWRGEPIVRMYYRVTAQGGRHITIFRDLVGGGWYRQNT